MASFIKTHLNNDYIYKKYIVDVYGYYEEKGFFIVDIRMDASAIDSVLDINRKLKFKNRDDAVYFVEEVTGYTPSAFPKTIKIEE